MYTSTVRPTIPWYILITSFPMVVSSNSSASLSNSLLKLRYRLIGKLSMVPYMYLDDPVEGWDRHGSGQMAMGCVALLIHSSSETPESGETQRTCPQGPMGQSGIRFQLPAFSITDNYGTINQNRKIGAFNLQTGDKDCGCRIP
ncbi:hypothetical protein N657DRAFT_317434 [Parathielavia appendiculata]|uniref:Uncharacterized protein n=1 Tax=Parathielavia appendiculata TaxID=2587402 RepID=A0AAN6TRN1_9PEZI|nr:hypothetical protein N657DRAFT_317434 [Parathielavia appendiculata]